MEKPIVPRKASKAFHFTKPFDKPLITTNHLEDVVDSYDVTNPPYSGTDPLKKLLKFLDNNPQIKIVSTDKNLGMAAFDIQDYNEMVLTHLSTPNYRLLQQLASVAPIFNQAFTKSKSNLLMLIRLLKIDAVIPPVYIKTLESLLKNTTIQLPSFHVLPKLHKVIKGTLIIPSRPIVGATNWYTTPVSKLLSRLLRPIVLSQDHIATNTFDVTSSLVFYNNFRQRDLENADNPVLIITLDISSLYTNIDLNILRNLVREKNPELEDLITYINDNNYFQYDGKTFKQENGIAMGTNAAPELANYYLLHLLDPDINTNTKVRLYKRFLDDLIILWNGTQLEFLTFYGHLNQLIPGIKFTYQISPHSNDFLDLRIMISSFGSLKPKISYSTHQKTLNKYAYISPKSCHPIHTLKGFIFGELGRYATNSSSMFYYLNTKQMFFKRLLARGYSHAFLRPIFDKHRYRQRPNYKKPIPQLNMFLRYSYRPGLTRLSKSIKDICRTSVPQYVPGTKFIISWKKSPNIFNKLCKSKLTAKQSEIISRRNTVLFSATLEPRRSQQDFGLNLKQASSSRKPQTLEPRRS